MRRGWVQTAGWTLATGAMVGLSWYGVDSVLHPASVTPRTEYASDGLPAGPPLTAADSAAPASRPAATLSAAPGSASPSPTTAAPSAPAAPSRTAVVAPSAPAGVPRTYSVAGGTAVFDLGTSSATLVSATPRQHWQVQVWRQPRWIRVIFHDEDGGGSAQDQVSVITCSWQGHPPTVQTYSS